MMATTGVKPVLIVGAGPTGMTAAMELARFGVPVRLVDKKSAPETTSRAIGVQARTLELFEQRGLAGEMLKIGNRSPAASIYGDGTRIARLEYSHVDSRYGYILFISQAETEPTDQRSLPERQKTPIHAATRCSTRPDSRIMSNDPTNSNSSIAVPFNGTPAAFKERCATFLVVLCNDKNMEMASRYLAPDCVLIHEDHPPVRGPRAFIEVWQKNLASMPDYHKNIKDIVVEPEPGDKGVAKVWVYSQITGIVPGATTDSIDMMRFTADGLFLESKDVQRTSKTS